MFKVDYLPEAFYQPHIRPTQVILHSAADGDGPTRLRPYFVQRKIKVESHIFIPFYEWQGLPVLMMPFNRRADANSAANRRRDGTGAISIETESNSIYSSEPWSQYQIDMIVRIIRMLNKEHGIPIRRCKTPEDPGIGYHSMFGRGNKNRLSGRWQFQGSRYRRSRRWTNAYGKTCPGYKRVEFFETKLFGLLHRGSVEEEGVIYPGYLLKKPMSGTAVLDLQQALNDVQGSGPQIKEDGDFGNKTDEKLRAVQTLIQTRFNLDPKDFHVDGVFGQKTAEYLQKILDGQPAKRTRGWYLVRGAYWYYLGREPSAKELEYWVPIADDSLHSANVAIQGSKESQRKGRKRIFEYDIAIIGAYLEELDRRPAPSELAGWVKAALSGGLSGVLESIWLSDEASKRRP